jgi:hypothetical protein
VGVTGRMKNVKRSENLLKKEKGRLKFSGGKFMESSARPKKRSSNILAAPPFSISKYMYATGYAEVTALLFDCYSAIHSDSKLFRYNSLTTVTIRLSTPFFYAQLYLSI